jgi:hypothetical protein
LFHLQLSNAAHGAFEQFLLLVSRMEQCVSHATQLIFWHCLQLPALDFDGRRPFQTAIDGHPIAPSHGIT